MSELRKYHPEIEPHHEILGKLPIVSVTGSIASGKDTAGAILQEELGFLPLSTSDILRNLVASTGMKPPFRREDLSAFVWDQISQHGDDFWVKHTLDVAAKSIKGTSFAGITHIGTRIPADISFLKKFPKTMSIWIEVDPDTRMTRLIDRGATPIQVDEFEDRDPKENEIMLPIKDNVDVVISNSGDIDLFRRDLVAAVSERFLLDDRKLKE